MLVREYLGERHTVTVVPDGFLWADKTYSSLSVIAQAITGTKWNGPRFFGLRMAREPKPNEPEPPQDRAAPSKHKHGRSSVRTSKGPIAGGAPHG